MSSSRKLRTKSTTIAMQIGTSKTMSMLTPALIAIETSMSTMMPMSTPVSIATSTLTLTQTPT